MAELRVLPPTFRQNCVASTVEYLKELLAQAESGEVVCVAIAAVHSDGSTGSGWSKHDEYSRLLGAVTRLQAKLATT